MNFWLIQVPGKMKIMAEIGETPNTTGALFWFPYWSRIEKGRTEAGERSPRSLVLEKNDPLAVQRNPFRRNKNLMMEKWWSIISQHAFCCKTLWNLAIHPLSQNNPPTFCRVVAAKPLTFAPGSWRLDKGVIPTQPSMVYNLIHTGNQPSTSPNSLSLLSSLLNSTLFVLLLYPGSTFLLASMTLCCLKLAAWGYLE